MYTMTKIFFTGIVRHHISKSLQYGRNLKNFLQDNWALNYLNGRYKKSRQSYDAGIL